MPEYATGRRFTNGNQLVGAYVDPPPGSGETTSMKVVFRCPGAVTLDFGDATEPYETGGLPEAVEHEYGVAGVYDVSIIDGLGRVRGAARIELPHYAGSPWDIYATPGARYPLP